MDVNDNGSNAGVADNSGQAGTPDQGGQAGDSTAGNGNQGASGNQNGQQPDREAENARLRQENRNLNKALANNRRSSQSYSPGNQENEQGDPFESPEGKYGIALQLATNEIRSRVEDVFDLYPEVPASEIARIRRNPWAFASHESFIRGDWNSAMTEIEQALLDRAEELAGTNNGSQNNSQNGGTGTPTQPAQVNTNPANPPEDPADPGSNEDVNPWTMPMDKLEKVANKEIRRKTAQANV